MFRHFRKHEMTQAPLDVRVFEEVLERGIHEERLALARQLSAFVADPATMRGEREAVEPVLLALARDPLPEVRAALAEGLIDARPLSPDLVFTIAADDPAIALPFIARARAIDGARQLAVFKGADAARRIALAGRSDAAPELIAAIAGEGQREVVAALLRNAHVRLNAGDLKMMFARFNKDQDVVELLLARDELPVEVRLAHVRLSTHRLRVAGEKDNALAAAQIAAAAQQAEEKALVAVLYATHDPEELRRALIFLAQKRALTPAVVFHAACRGHAGVLAQTLTLLAGHGPRRAQKVLRGRGLLGFKHLYANSELPEDLFPLAEAVLATARDLGMDECGRAKADAAAFGRKVLAHLMTTHAHLPMAEKAHMVRLLARFTDSDVRKLAERLGDEMSLAA